MPTEVSSTSTEYEAGEGGREGRGISPVAVWAMGNLLSLKIIKMS
jgi:hypothetical protein